MNYKPYKRYHSVEFCPKINCNNIAERNDILISYFANREHFSNHTIYSSSFFDNMTIKEPIHTLQISSDTKLKLYNIKQSKKLDITNTLEPKINTLRKFKTKSNNLKIR